MLDCIEPALLRDGAHDVAAGDWNRRIGQTCLEICRLGVSAQSTADLLRAAGEHMLRRLRLSSLVIWSRDGGQFRPSVTLGHEAAIVSLLARVPDPAALKDERAVVRLLREWNDDDVQRQAGGWSFGGAMIEESEGCLGALFVCSDQHEGDQLCAAADAAANELGLLLGAVRRNAAHRETARVIDLVDRYASLAMIRVDASGRCIHWSQAAETLFGWSQQDVSNRPLPIAAPDSREAFWCSFRHAIGARSPASLPLRGQRWDGAPLILAVTLVPVLNRLEEVSEVLLLVSDESYASTLEQHLRLELEASSVLSRSASFDAARSQLSSLVGRRLGCRAVEIWERASHDGRWSLSCVWRSEGESAERDPTLQRAISNSALDALAEIGNVAEISGSGALRAADRTGTASAADVDGVAVPVRALEDTAGMLILLHPEAIGARAQLYRTVGSLAQRMGEAIGRDRMASLLRDSEASLRQSRKMEAIGMLAGGIAHDFNNLLTVILGNCEMLLESDNLESQTREFLDEVQTAGLKAASLTRQLLMFSRKRAPIPTVMDLRKHIRELAKMLQRVVGEHVAITTQVAQDTYPVHLDAVEFEQILMNLAVNARDAMPEGGTVIISTANVTLRARDVTHRHNVHPGEFVAVSVTDTGSGMDELTKARVFEPFFTTKEPTKGTGMGLATVFGIVARCRGFIDVESKIGEGTSFTMYLPRAAMGIAPRVVSDRPVEDPRGTETILVVEDEEVLRNLVRRILEVHGYTVLAASNGEEAMSQLHRNPERIGLVLSDVVMPGLSGVGLADRLRGQGSSVPVILMSGYPDLSEDGAAVPAERLLCKPFTSDVLVRAVRDALNASTVPLPPSSTPAQRRS